MSELQTLKMKIVELPDKYPRTHEATFGAGLSQAQGQIQTIGKVIEDAIKALNTGLDVHDQPINKWQIGQGLRRLVAETRKPAFYDLIRTTLGRLTTAELYTCITELEQIAGRIK